MMPRGDGWRWRAPPGWPRWLSSLLALWLAQVVAELAFSFALPFVPLYIQELGVTDTDQAGLWAGAMAGGFALVMGLMGPIWGVIADRFGRRLMILRALFGACLVIGAMAFVQTPEQLFVLRLVQGSVTGVVAATTTVVSLTVPRRHLATALGLMHAAMFVGAALGPLVGGLTSDAFGFRTAFLITGGLFLAAGLLVLLLVVEPPREPGELTAARQPLLADLAGLLRQPGLIAIIALMTIIRFATNAPLPILPLFVQQLVDDRSRLATITGATVAITGIASTVSAILIGPLAGRFGRYRCLLLALALAAAASAPQALVTTIWQLLALRTLLGLAVGGLSPLAQALFTDRTPSGQRGTAFGLLATANAIGNGAGPVLGSLLAAGFGLPAVFYGITPTFLLAAWLLRHADAGRRRSGPSEATTEPTRQ